MIKKIIITFVVVLLLCSGLRVYASSARITKTTKVYVIVKNKIKKYNIKKGVKVSVLKKKGGWAQIKYKKRECYIPTKYLKPISKKTPIHKPTKIDELISYANKLIGTPYVRNGKTEKGLDCSNFVAYCFKHIGIKLPTSLSSLARTTKNMVRIESILKAKRGDLLFFSSDTSDTISHTGIYIGNSRIIHASEVAGKVVVSDLTDYYTRNFCYILRYDSTN